MIFVNIFKEGCGLIGMKNEMNEWMNKRKRKRDVMG